MEAASPPRVDIEQLHGVGPALATEMRGYGFASTLDLLRFTPPRTGAVLAQIAGISEIMVLSSLIPQARLFRLPHMTESRVDRLLDESAMKIAHIAWLDDDRLDDLLGGPSPDELRDIREAALRCHATGIAAISVLGPDEMPLQGVEIAIGNPYPLEMPHNARWHTDENGLAFMQHLRPVEFAISVAADGFAPQRVLCKPGQDWCDTRLVFLEPGDGSRLVHDEFSQGFSYHLDTMPALRRTIAFADMPDDAIFTLGADGILHGLQRRQVGPNAEYYTVMDAPPAPGFDAGATIAFEGGIAVAADGTAWLNSF